MQSRNNSNYKGIDISNHNGNVDLSKMQAQGYTCLYVKSSEGRTVQDAYFRQNYNNAKANGLRVGFYHFYHSDSDVTQQVQNFINVTQGCQPDLKVAIDVEITNNVSNADRCAGVLEFARQVKEKTGWDCCIYTYTSFAKESLNSSVVSLPLWIAHYGVNQPSDNGIWSEWVGFQYSDSGYVDGVGKCDVNEFNDGIFLNGVSQPVIQNYVVQNNDNMEGDFMAKKYQNGSTPEIVYADCSLTKQVGKLDPWEVATAVCDVNGRIGIVYEGVDENGIKCNKIGFTKYRGGL